MKKLVIFDLDGTLLNTIDDITNSINRALDSVKLARVTVDEAKYFVGSGVDILIDRLLRYELGEEYESKKDSYFNVLRKTYCDDYAVNKDYYRTILRRQDILGKEIPKTKAIHSTLITTFGLAYNEYSGAFDKVITLEDIFSK